MFYAANEQQITLTIPNVQDSDSAKLQVLAFDGIEGINSEYAFEITLVSKHLRYDISRLLNQTACLSFTPDNKNIIHGIIPFVKRGAVGKDYTLFKILLVPRFYQLNNEVDQRAFINQSVPDIITTVLSEKGYQQGDGFDFVFKLKETYPKREFCCEYDETTADFIHRLCEEEGINISYQHTKDNHCMIFSDDNHFFPALPNSYQYMADTGTVADTPVFKRFDVNLSTSTASASYRNYNFKTKKIPEGTANQTIHQKGNDAVEPNLEHYDYPQQHMDQARGEHYAKLQIQRLKTYHLTSEAYTDIPELKSGYTFKIEGYPALDTMDATEDWLAVQIYHQGRQPQVIEALGSEASAIIQEPMFLFKHYQHPISDSLQFPFDEFKQGYRNVLLSTPKNNPFRPQMLHPKQRVLGSQTAIVTGAAGEEIYCDEYGRVKLLFHWDRINPKNENSSHWVRVASNWAHDGYGAVVIPRVGMEVMVDFLEGDIDNPIIKGALHNGVNKVPYDLPANKTRSVFKTSSSKGGVGSNEFRIEDKAGEEQIFVQAERNYDALTKHNHTITVNNNSHLQVGNEHSETITGNRYTKNLAEEHHLTDQNRLTQIMGNDELTIAQSEHKVVGTIYTSQTGQEITLTAGEQIVVDGGLSLTLQGGGNHIVLNPAGIWISTPPLPFGGSASTNAREGCPTGMCPASPTVGNPVNPILGCKILTPETDIALPAPEPFIFSRSYNSRNERISTLGQGWTATGENTALLVNDSKITVIDGYGRHIEFSPLHHGQAHYSASEGFYLQRGGLTDNETLSAGNHWFDVVDNNLLTSPENYFIFLPNSCLVFSLLDKQYRLMQTISKHGYSTHYTWHNNTINTLQDSAGRYYALAYQNYPAINNEDTGQRLIAIGLIDLDHYSKDTLTTARYTLDSPAINWLVNYNYNGQGDLIKVNNKQGDTQRLFDYQNHILTAHGQPNGQYNRYQYDSYTPQGKVIEQHEQDGLSYYYTYQTDHTEVLDSLNRTERYYFTGTGGDQRWTSLTRADGSSVQFEYDILGRQIATIDPLGRKTTTAYNEQGKITSKTFADGSQVQYVIDDKLGQPIQIIDPEGNITTLSYDDKGNLATITNALEVTTSYYYEDANQPDKPTKIVEANGATKQFKWHSTGQLASYTDCSNFTSTKDYNKLGLLVAETNAKGETTTYHYNSLNQLTKTTLADGGMVNYQYDPLGRLIKLTNPAQQSSTFSYNRFGQVIKSTNTEGLSKYFSYDPAKRLVKLTNENGADTTFSYDQLDRLIEEIGFDQHSQQKHYNAADELISLTDSNGSAITYQYDLLGRLITRNIPATPNTQAITEQFSWTLNGLLQQATNGQSTITYHYDAIGQLLSESQKQGAWQHNIQHIYDLIGNPEQTQYNHAPVIKWLRYGSGHIHSMLIGQSQINYQRDELHRELTQQTFINAQPQPLFEANKAYNPLGLLDEQTINSAQQQDWTRNYQYDPLGQLTRINDSLLPSISYQYDNLGRLIGSKHPTEQYQYYYDSANNRCSQGQINSQSETTINFTQGTPDPILLDFTKEAKQSAQANPIWLNNRITELNNQHYHYDQAGNLTSINQGQQQLNLFYDGANRLTKVEKLNHNSLVLTATYGYDSFSRRISKTVSQQGKATTTYYGWDDNNLVTEQTHQQQTTIVYSPNSFVPLVKMEQHNQNQAEVQLSFYQVDHLGTPLRLVDELGNITWQAESDDWRAVKNAQGAKQPIRFQGQYEDQETGLYYNRNRFYSPILGRYINHDPIGLAGGFNTYSYVDNPNNWVDPLGLELSAAEQAIRVGYYPPDAAINEVGVTVAGVNKWLCRAVLSEKSGFTAPYQYLSYARKIGLDKFDVNLPVAERYMEGYALHYGNLSPVFLEGLHGLKILRGSPIISWAFGGNGSFSGFSGIATEWGIKGWGDATLGLPIGGGNNLGSCQLTQ